MAQILEQLDGLLCSQCHKYLSVLPVKVYEDGSVKCGRCCIGDGGGVMSMYEKIADQCLFKCINRYEGCRRLLLPSEVLSHEQTCTAKMYSCPSCHINPQLSAFELLQHFKQSHSDYVLKNNILTLTFSENIIKEKYFYVQDDIIFIVFLRYVSGYLYISAVTLGELKNVKQHFRIIKESFAFQHVTATRECASMKNFNMDHYFKIYINDCLNQFTRIEIFLDPTEASIRSYEIRSSSCVAKRNSAIKPREIKFTSEFSYKFPHYKITPCGSAFYSDQEKRRFELICSNCKDFLVSPYQKCKMKQHSICGNCNAWCGLCECPTRRAPGSFIRDRSLLVSCKWDCGIQCIFDKLIDHEKTCRMNKRKCPVCFVEMNLKYLQKHLPLEHGYDFVDKHLTTILRQQYLSNNQKDAVYFIKSNRIFMMKSQMDIVKRSINLQETSVTHFNLKITPCDDISGLELCVIVEDNCLKLENNEIDVILETNPTFYLRYI